MLFNGQLHRQLIRISSNRRRLFGSFLNSSNNAAPSSNPWRVIQEFERSPLHNDPQAIQTYVEALNRTGQGRRALELVGRGLQQHSPQQLVQQHSTQQMIEPVALQPSLQMSGRSTATRPISSSRFTADSSPSGLGGPGSKDQPLHIISRPPPQTAKDKFWSAVKVTSVIWILIALASTYSEEISKLNGKNFTVFSEVDPQNSLKYKFGDVQGVDEAKEELQEIVEFLRDPAKFTRLGGKLPKGVLLTGPPGTGKTLLARAVAGEAQVPFFFCSGSEFDEMYVGVGAKRIRELFAQAKKRSPCIIFIDEIDAVGSKRNPRDQNYARMTLNQLLVEMDGFSQTSGIIVIGATNFPQTLDKALIRPGRFDRNVVVSLPDVKGRFEILKVHTRVVPLADNVQLKIIARATPGFSGADLANLVNYAALRAAASNATEVGMTDLEWAIDRIIMGAEKKSAVISEKNRRATAFHEAGHALVALHTSGAMTIHKATIMPRGPALGMVSQLPDEDDSQWTRRQFKARIDVAMGGRCAEELIYGAEDVSAGAASDIEQATNIARMMVARIGMGSDSLGKVLLDNEDYEKLSDETKRQVDKETRQQIEDGYQRAMNILKTHRTQLDRLANALVEYETLSREEIEKVVRGESLHRDPL